MLPRLHRYRDGWVLSGWPVQITKDGKHWVLVSEYYKASSWLESSGLSGEWFETRREAMEAFMLALELRPGLTPASPPPCSLISPGLYQLDNHLRASRHAGRWQIIMASGKVLANTRTLWQAAWKAHTHTLSHSLRPRSGWVLHAGPQVVWSRLPS